MDEKQGQGLPLDGSYGCGTLAELTIVTRKGDREQEETFTIPYVLINFGALLAVNSMNLIAGYKVVKQGDVNHLRELGL
jgi:hypothetical protein